MMIHKTCVVRGMLRRLSGQPGINSNAALTVLISRRTGMKWSLEYITERKSL